MPPLPVRPTSASPIKVLLANLPRMLSELLYRVLENVPDIQVVYPPTRPLGICALRDIDSIEVILVGCSNAEVFELTRKWLESIREQHPQVRVLVLSEDPDYNETVALFRAGANGILSGQDLDIDLLCKSIRCVYQGQVWANNGLMKHLVASLSIPRSRVATNVRGNRLLTIREQQILDLLAGGLRNSELAAALDLSEHTIKNHLFRIYDKLGVSNRTEAALYAVSPRP